MPSSNEPLHVASDRWMSALCHTSVLGRRHQYRKRSKKSYFCQTLPTTWKLTLVSTWQGTRKWKHQNKVMEGFFECFSLGTELGTSSKTYLQTNVVLSKRLGEADLKVITWKIFQFQLEFDSWAGWLVPLDISWYLHWSQHKQPGVPAGNFIF